MIYVITTFEKQTEVQAIGLNMVVSAQQVTTLIMKMLQKY